MNGSSASPEYRRYRPSPSLAAVADELWVQDCGPVAGAPPTTIMPTGRVELVFQYSDQFQIRNGGEFHDLPRCHVVGQRNRPIQVRASGKTGMVIARLWPWSAQALFGPALVDLRNHVIDLELMWPAHRLHALLECLSEAVSARARAQWVETFLADRLLATKPDPLGQLAVIQMHRHGGRLGIGCLSGQFNLGRRQFNRRFGAAVGLPPKPMSQLFRAHQAIGELKAGRGIQDVVFQCGFADQPHLIRELLAHSGRRPGQLAKPGDSSASRCFNSSQPSAICGTTYL